MSEQVKKLLSSKKFLHENCTMTLSQRAMAVKRLYPESSVSASAIQRFYKKSNIKFKKLRQKRTSWHDSYRAQFSSDRQRLQQELRAIDDDGECEIFQVDETVFIGSDHLAKAFSQANNNIRIDLVGSQQSQTAKVIGALSNKGTYFYWVQPEYFVKEDVLKFITEIKRRQRGKSWGIFWDNCPTHRAKVVHEYMLENDIPHAFNVAYCPQYNGIESLWAWQKYTFRKRLTLAKSKKEVLDVVQTVIDLQKEVQDKRDMLIRIANYGWK